MASKREMGACTSVLDKLGPQAATSRMIDLLQHRYSTQIQSHKGQVLLFSAHCNGRSLIRLNMIGKSKSPWFEDLIKRI